MSVNSSSSSSSLHPPEDMFNTTLRCIRSTTGSFIFISFTVVSVLFLLPLCALVLLLGVRRWRLQRSGTVSHTDLITYYMVVMELLAVFSSVLISASVLADHQEALIGGVYILFANTVGQMYFHVLTCLERYLAVVHPITYHGLRKSLSTALRNVVVSGVWLLSFLLTLVPFVWNQSDTIAASIWISLFALAFISFCSVSVLRTLLRPGPGDGGEAGAHQRPGAQAKLRALYTMVAVLGAMVLRFGVDVVIALTSTHLSEEDKCIFFLSSFWISMPSSLVLPLIFLLRAGVFQRCSGSGGSD